jgi:hypothetical protein
MRLAASDVLRQTSSILTLDLDCLQNAILADLGALQITATPPQVSSLLSALRDYIEEFDQCAKRAGLDPSAWKGKLEYVRGRVVTQVVNQLRPPVEGWAADPSEPDRAEYARLLVTIRSCCNDPDGILAFGAADSSAPGAAPAVQDDISEENILRNLERTLAGLVGIDDLKRLIAMDVYDFLSSRQSRGRVFWGDSGVGKTELAQRLAGLREGFPPLNLGAGEVRYVSGVDGRIEVKQVVDSLPSVSILLIDEADKCLDPGAGMVSAEDALQTRYAIVTHFQRRQILWVFLGIFAHARGQGPLADGSMHKIFGDELATRLDFVDWRFPSWTTSSLLQAVNGSAIRRKLEYQDEAVLILVDYCAGVGGGVRTFDNVEAAIVRHLRMKGGDLARPVGPDVVRDVLARRVGRPTQSRQ